MGTLLHSSLGEIGISSESLYFTGISEPSGNAGLVIVSLGPGELFAFAFLVSCPIEVPMVSERARVQ
jgi:hypothetical protein